MALSYHPSLEVSVTKFMHWKKAGLTQCAICQTDLRQQIDNCRSLSRNDRFCGISPPSRPHSPGLCYGSHKIAGPDADRRWTGLKKYPRRLEP